MDIKKKLKNCYALNFDIFLRNALFHNPCDHCDHGFLASLNSGRQFGSVRLVWCPRKRDVIMIIALIDMSVVFRFR
jgi:hypothetical protein